MPTQKKKVKPTFFFLTQMLKASRNDSFSHVPDTVSAPTFVSNSVQLQLDLIFCEALDTHKRKRQVHTTKWNFLFRLSSVCKP